MWAGGRVVGGWINLKEVDKKERLEEKENGAPPPTPP